MDVYLLIGNPNTRKSTVLRSLTGCFNRSVRDIQRIGEKAPVRLYARVGCLQDSKTSPEAFVAEVQRTRCAALLCCLAPSAHVVEPERMPDAAAYLAYFMAQGWTLRAIAVLGQNGGDLRSPLLRQFPLAPSAPINLTAQAVRAHFGWL